MEPPSPRNRQQLVTIEAFRAYPYILSSPPVTLCLVGGGCLLGINLEVAVVAFSQGLCPRATT
jgi:hypothetical protein